MPLVDEHEALEKAFGHAQPEHFAWQTEHPVVAEREAALVRAAFLPLQGRLLDLGCGEGATLWHLGSPAGATGVDLFEDKIEFARQTLPNCKFVRASVYELPFADASFDHILIRDVIHHLEDPRRFVAECSRVLAAGGRIDVLEPCRNNPLILLHALTNRAERGELRSTVGYLVGLFRPGFEVVSTAKHQALPIHRIVFHPKLGRPQAAGSPRVRAATAWIEKTADALLPRWARAYIHVRLVLR